MAGTKNPRPWWVALVAVLVALLVRLLRLTWRVTVVGEPPARGRSLFAFWHGDQVALTSARVTPRPALLVSLSRDGELGAVAVRWLGFEVVRGSSSTGAVAGTMGLVRRLRSGGSVGLAADGPRGPRCRVGSGPERLAHLGQASLVPVAAAARRSLALSTWDRMQVPAPFTRVAVVWGRLDPGEGLQQGLDRVGALARVAVDGGSGC